MKKWMAVVVLIAGLAAVSGAAAAGQSGNLSGGNLSGIWKGAFPFNGDSVALTFHLTAAGDGVTGTVEGLPTTPVEIHEGKVDSGTVTFWVNTDYEGQTYKLICHGTISAAGDEIAFTMGTEDGGWSTQFTAKKSVDMAAAPSPLDVTGDWKGAFAFNGGSVPLTFHLKSENGVVSGTVEGLETSPAEIHEGKIDGDTVTFWLNTDYQGQTYKLVYKGKIAGGKIAFTLGTEDGGWGTDLTATRGS